MTSAWPDEKQDARKKRDNPFMCVFVLPRLLHLVQIAVKLSFIFAVSGFHNL